MALHTRPKSSENPSTPPCFGEGKPWRVRSFEWYSRDPKDPNGDFLSAMAMLLRDMPVHEKLHGVYWETREISVKAIKAYRKAGIPPPYPYFLFDKSNQIFGYGAFDAQDTADDMAWIACMFMEMGLKTAFPMPSAGTDDEIGAHTSAGRNHHQRPD